MLAAYLWREFGADLACHLARVRNPRAADLAPGIRRFMGVGNASGIGLVPFVVRHPRIIDRWIRLREIALAEVRSMPLPADDPRCDRIVAGLDRAARYFRLEPAGELDEFQPGRAVAADLKLAEDMFARLRARNGDDTGPVHNVGNALLEQARVGLTVEAQEFINALLLEIHDDGRVDLDSLYADEALSFPPHMRAGTLLKLLREHFAWAVRYRPASARDRPYFWYASEEIMEPRRGRRGSTMANFTSCRSTSSAESRNCLPRWCNFRPRSRSDGSSPAIPICATWRAGSIPWPTSGSTQRL